VEFDDVFALLVPLEAVDVLEVEALDEEVLALELFGEEYSVSFLAEAL
jgi:hypothetical protein